MAQLRVLKRRRGRTLRIGRNATPAHPQPASSRGGRRIVHAVILICLLPMFAQCFQYMTDIPPLYMLSKVWPFLMLPVAVWAFITLDVPYKLLHIGALFWLLAVTPMVGILHLGNGFSDAMATTVKVWSFSYLFSAAGMLMLLRPAPETVRQVMIGLGLGTYAVMALLWISVPESAYGRGDLETKLFMVDVERGYRIYMPMFFGVMLIFYLNRSAWIRFAWWKPVGVAIAFILLLAIYKQRAALASAALAVIVGGVLSLQRWRTAAFTLLALLACIGAFAFLAEQQTVELKANLGGSLAVREVSVATAWNYLSIDPVRWILGVGGTTRLGNVTLGRLFNNPMFFLADIGWLGVLFEYGAVGVILILLIHGAGLRLALRWARPDDPLSQAFVDYIIYLLAGSVVYSAVFTPGELMTVMALSYYLARAVPKPPDGEGVTAVRYSRSTPFRGIVPWPGRYHSGYRFVRLRPASAAHRASFRPVDL
jgi:hypothetical protein